MMAAMIRPEALAVIISFNAGLVIGAGIAWALTMYVWEPIEAEETKHDFEIM